VNHGSVAPWSWNQHATFLTPQEMLDRLGLNLTGWHTEFIGNPERELTGPGGTTATVKDIVLALRRKS